MSTSKPRLVRLASDAYCWCKILWGFHAKETLWRILTQVTYIVWVQPPSLFTTLRVDLWSANSPQRRKEALRCLRMTPIIKLICRLVLPLLRWIRPLHLPVPWSYEALTIAAGGHAMPNEKALVWSCLKQAVYCKVWTIDQANPRDTWQIEQPIWTYLVWKWGVSSLLTPHRFPAWCRVRALRSARYLNGSETRGVCFSSPTLAAFLSLDIMQLLGRCLTL